MGLSFRLRIQPEKGGNIAVIQMRDLTEDHRLSHASHLAAVAMKDVSAHHLVNPGDLVFRSRGKTTTTSIIDEPIDGTIIAAPLLRIRVVSPKVLPEYLCWFINQPSSQAFLHSRATGTAMVMIGKSTLDSLAVPVPSRARQKQISALAALSDREQTLLADLAKQRKKLIAGTLMKLATEHESSTRHYPH